LFNKKINISTLYKEFISSKKEKRKVEIINVLIKNDAIDEIIDILKSGKYNKENKYYILIYLVETNFDYSKIKPALDLLNIRNDGVEEYFQNIMLRKLFDDKKKSNTDELFHILNNYSYFTESNKKIIYEHLVPQDIDLSNLKIAFDNFSSFYQKEIITLLIEKKEFSEIESNYINEGFNELLIDFLLSEKDDDSVIRLKSLYNRFAESKHKDDKNSKFMIINKLIDLALNENENEQNVRSNNIEEVKFLFNECKDVTKRDKLILKMLKYDEQDILLDLLTLKNCTKENKALVVIFLIENSEDLNILKILFLKSPNSYKEKIIDKLLGMNATDELEKNYLGYEYDEKIFNELIFRNQDNKTALKRLYYSDISLIDKSEIINLLIDLNSINELSKILFDNKCSEQSEIIIMSYLVEESSNTILLKNIFDRGNDSFKERVIDRLISINAFVELEKEYFNMGYDERIIRLLLEDGKFNKESLKLFHAKSKDKNSRNIIVASLIELKAMSELSEIVTDEKCLEENKNKIIIFIVDECSDLGILRKVFEVSNGSFQEMLIEKLLNENLVQELILNYLNAGYNIEIIELYIANDIDISVNKLVYLYKTLEDIESKLKIIDKLIQLNAVYDLKEIYKASKFRNILFPKLIVLPSIFSEKNMVSYIVKNIEKDIDDIKSKNKNDKEYFLKVILKYLDLIGTSLNPVKLHKAMNNNFSYFFNKGLLEDMEFYLALCSFINIKKFKKEVLGIKDNFVIADDIKIHEKQIKDKYSKLMGLAKNENDIEKILKKRNRDISKLFTKEKFDIFFKISEMYINKSKNSTEVIYSGEKISIEKLLNNIEIVEDKKDEEKKVTKYLLEKLNNLVDSNEIMKVKKRVDNIKYLLVSKKDFCFTLQDLTEKELDNNELIHKLGEILVESNDLDIKKEILKIAHKSKKNIWLIYIHNVSNEKELIDYIFNAIRNKFFLGNFSFILDRNELWDEIRFKMIVLEHLFYFIFNSTKNEVLDLINFLRTDLTKFPKDMQDSVKNIIMISVNRNK